MEGDSCQHGDKEESKRTEDEVVKRDRKQYTGCKEVIPNDPVIDHVQAERETRNHLPHPHAVRVNVATFVIHTSIRKLRVTSGRHEEDETGAEADDPS